MSENGLEDSLFVLPGSIDGAESVAERDKGTPPSDAPECVLLARYLDPPRFSACPLRDSSMLLSLTIGFSLVAVRMSLPQEDAMAFEGL